jgi:glucose/arabinose dehydrogenase
VARGRTTLRPLRAVLFLLACAATPAGAAAQHLIAQPFATGLSFPTAFVGDPTAANRHFVVEQNGFIRVLVDGVVQPTPFLNLSAAISSGGERGLLGMALDPNYAINRRFYVYFTRAEDPATPCNPSPTGAGCEIGDLVVARFRRSVGSELVADPSSGFALNWTSLGQSFIEHSEFGNHNGGTLMFGPDGYLYIAVGDGGSSNDPYNSGQNGDTFLGKMLRIDVDVADSDPQGYDVPPDNPFVADPTTGFPEIWDFGLRNPWKFSFDDPTRGGTGALFIADVGQNHWEEINWEPADSGGRNYGWRIREGAHPNIATPAAFLPLTDPVYEYSHVAGESALQGTSITGGYVYRGTNLSAVWRGRYFFADFPHRRVWSAAVSDVTGAISGIIDHTAGFGAPSVSSFGVDQNGELYIVGYGATNQGVIYRLCELTITRGQDEFWNTGGTGTIRIDTQPGCSWSLSVTSPWIIPLSGTSGTGSGTVVFRVLPSGNVGRAGSINLSGLPIEISQSGEAPIHGDLDANASGDILWQHTDGRLAVWFMNNTTLVDGRQFGPGPLADTAWRLVAAGDFDGDGSRDAVFQHQSDGRLAIWLMSQTVQLSGGPLTPAQVPDLNWKIRAAADIDRDGWLDLIWQHQIDGSIAVWLMTGTQLRDGRLLTPGAVPDTNWRIVGAGDLNDDGHADLLWQHQGNGLMSAWFMNGTSLVSGVLLSPGQVTDTNWKISAVADMNGDRHIDLIWRNQVNGVLSIWLMNGITRIGDGLHLTPGQVPDTNWQIVGPR